MAQRDAFKAEEIPITMSSPNPGTAYSENAGTAASAEMPKNSGYTYNPYAFNHATGSDFNTSGADYHRMSSATPGAETSFYNTNIKKKKKSIPFVAALIAVIVTASASGFGAYYATRFFDGVNRVNIEEVTGGNNKKNQAPAVVAQPVADKDGNKLLTTPEIVDKVGPAVVGIINMGEVPTYGFGFGFSEEGGITEQGSGSGVIISEEGYIVTNNHVVENATELTVILNTNEEYKADLCRIAKENSAAEDRVFQDDGIYDLIALLQLPVVV